MLKNPVSRKRTTQAAVRRPRRPSPHTTVIASKCALPQTRQHPLFGTVHTKDIDDAGVEFFPLLAPPDFKVSAVFQGDDSYLWIGVDPRSGPAAIVPIVLVKGDALRALVTEYLKHLNAPIFGGVR